MNIVLVKTEEDFKKIYTIKQLVFVHEQNIPTEIVFDEMDNHSFHFLLIEENISIATARLTLHPDGYHLHRLAVIAEYRNLGYAKALLTFIENFALENGILSIKLHAQMHALAFYQKLGYSCVGLPFLEANIQHITMEKCLCNKPLQEQN